MSNFEETVEELKKLIPVTGDWGLVLYTDGGYRGELIEKTKITFGWILEIVLRSDHSSKFTVIPKRWVVERTFAWFESYRRLSKDFEYLTDTSEVMIQIAMIRLMLNRIKN